MSRRSLACLSIAILAEVPSFAQTTLRVSVDSSGAQANQGGGSAAIPADGRYVAFFSDATSLVPGDTSAIYDDLVHDRGDASAFTSLCFGDPIQLGATRAYQVYYRDPNLAFCPGGFNVTGAIAITWGS